MPVAVTTYWPAQPSEDTSPLLHRLTIDGVGEPGFASSNRAIASRTDKKDGDRGHEKGRAEEEVKLRRQPAAIEQRAARERRKYSSKAADADRPPHAGGAHRCRIERRPDGIQARHRRVCDDTEQ